MTDEAAGDVARYGAGVLADDLGHPLLRTAAAERVVSLVPSLTEAVAATRPQALVGATDWCTHPQDLDVVRVRGTKNPDVARIMDLRPDLVVANREENRELDVRRLRAAGVPVWVTEIRSVDEALASMARLLTDGLGWDVPEWLASAREVWAAPPRLTGLAVAVPIWRDPWMVVGRDTFAGDVLARLGCRNAYAEADDRYPRIEVDELTEIGLDAILLPDEPYPFSLGDGPEMFPRTPVVLVSGRLLTWYGPSLVPARSSLESVLGRIEPAG